MFIVPVRLSGEYIPNLICQSLGCYNQLEQLSEGGMAMVNKYMIHASSGTWLSGSSGAKHFQRNNVERHYQAIVLPPSLETVKAIQGFFANYSLHSPKQAFRVIVGRVTGLVRGEAAASGGFISNKLE